MRTAIEPRLLSKIARHNLLLQAILEGHREKRELQGVLGISRSTIDRVVRDLSEEGIIIRQASECSLTLSGRFALEVFECLKTKYQKIEEAQPLLSQLDADHPFPPCVVWDSDTITTDQPHPHEPIDKLDQLLEDSRSIRAVLSVVPPRFEEAYSTRITEENFEAQIVLGNLVAQYLVESFRECLTILLQTETATVWRVEETLPLGFCIFDQHTLWLPTYDDEGKLLGAFVSDTESVVTWANDMFHRYRERGVQEIIRGDGSYALQG